MNPATEPGGDDGYDVVARALVACGVTDVFGLIGYANLNAVVRATQLGVRFHSSRHEAGGVSMASGFARVSGGVGVATVTRGPALTNALTAITSAVRESVPMVVYAGDTARDDLWNPQRVDQEAFIAPTGAGFRRCEDAADLDVTVRAAFAAAVHERRPVVLDIPADLVHAPAVAQRRTPHLVTAPEAGGNRGEVPDLSTVADLLMRAQRPLVLAGLGAVRAGAGPALSEVGALSGALLATTLPASGYFADEEFSLGFVGGFALPARQDLVRQADVVLAVGASLNPHTTMEGQLLRGATVIHCDLDPEAIGRKHRVDIAVTGDGHAIATQLVQECRRLTRTSPGFRSPATRRAIVDSERGIDIPQGSTDEGVDPRAALRAIDDALPSRPRIVFDVGHFATFACQSFRVGFPGQLLPCQGFAAVGLGLPTAIGVAMASPDETVLGIVGDGGLLMALADLETAARLAPNLVLVVLNDRAYGAEVHHARKHQLSPDLVQLPTPPFAAMAATMGFASDTLTAPDDFRILTEFLRQKGPKLLDVRINPSVIGASRYKADAASEVHQ